MIFKVINDKGITVMFTSDRECIPDEDILSAMYQSGYRFMLDDKSVTMKKLKELRSEEK